MLHTHSTARTTSSPANVLFCHPGRSQWQVSSRGWPNCRHFCKSRSSSSRFSRWSRSSSTSLSSRQGPVPSTRSCAS
ncbi:hypothetical protein ACFPRL_32845 [Pseudoclavibacter helvolus]